LAQIKVKSMSTTKTSTPSAKEEHMKEKEDEGNDIHRHASATSSSSTLASSSSTSKVSKKKIKKQKQKQKEEEEEEQQQQQLVEQEEENMNMMKSDKEEKKKTSKRRNKILKAKTDTKVSRYVYGFGINDADYILTRREEVYGSSGKKEVWRCPYYLAWTRMLKMCYSERFLEAHPTYTGCSVCEEWRSFLAFRQWMMAHVEMIGWDSFIQENRQLSRCFIVRGSKIFSPETCLFVPQAINKLLNDRTAARGLLPLGVCPLGEHTYGASISRGYRKRVTSASGGGVGVAATTSVAAIIDTSTITTSDWPRTTPEPPSSSSSSSSLRFPSIYISPNTNNTETTTTSNHDLNHSARKCYIGTYNSPQEAHKAYMIEKGYYILQVANSLTHPYDKRLAFCLSRIAWNEFLSSHADLTVPSPLLRKKERKEMKKKKKNEKEKEEEEEEEEEEER